MEEPEFIASIECKFPYDDRIASLELTKQACSLSPNATFAVVDEISRPPAGEHVSSQLSAELLSYVEQHLTHPLSTPIIAIARKLVSGQGVSVADSLLAFRQIERFPGQYCALSIAYFACDDIDGTADREFNRIMAAWNAA